MVGRSDIRAEFYVPRSDQSIGPGGSTNCPRAVTPGGTPDARSRYLPGRSRHGKSRAVRASTQRASSMLVAFGAGARPLRRGPRRYPWLPLVARCCRRSEPRWRAGSSVPGCPAHRRAGHDLRVGGGDGYERDHRFRAAPPRAARGVPRFAGHARPCDGHSPNRYWTFRARRPRAAAAEHPAPRERVGYSPGSAGERPWRAEVDAGGVRGALRALADRWRGLTLAEGATPQGWAWRPSGGGR